MLLASVLALLAGILLFFGTGGTASRRSESANATIRMASVAIALVGLLGVFAFFPK